MTHLFDTRAPLPQRTLIRRAAVELLSGLKRINGGYLEEVRSFGGIVRTYTDEPDIQLFMKSMGRAPAIGVQLATREFETLAIGGRQAKSEIQLLLYHLNQHSRDALEGRHEMDSVAALNDGADPGLDVMMEHAIELLHGSYPTGDTTTVKQIRIQREEELATLPELTLWLQTYRVTTQSYTGSREFRTAEQLINSLHWRTTTDPNEPNRPAPAVAPTTIDADSDP